MDHVNERRGRRLEYRQPLERRIPFAAETQNLFVKVFLAREMPDIPAASASSFVVVPAKPLRAKSGTAAATIALRRSSLSNRVTAMAARK